MVSRQSIRLSVLAVLCLALAVAVLGATSVVRKVETFQPIGVVGIEQQGFWRIAANGDATTGLLEGDLVYQADGHRIESLTEELRAAPSLQLLVLRSGVPTEVSYQRPPVSVDLPYLVLAAIGGLYLIIGLYILLRDRRRQGWLFALWCIGSAATYLLTPSSYRDSIGQWIYLAEEIARAVVPALTVHLFLVFPRPLAIVDSQPGQSGSGSTGRARLSWLYLPGVALLAAEMTLIFGRGIGAGTVQAALPTLDRLFLVHLVLYALLALGILVMRLRAHAEWEQRRQLQWIVVGLGAGYLPFLGLYLIPYLLGQGPGRWLEILAILPLGLVPLTFAWAILRYKLWDLGVVIRDTLTTVATVLLAAAGFALANLVIGQSLPAEFGAARSAVAFGSGLAVASLVIPARRHLGGFFEHLQYGSALSKRRALADFGRTLIEERNLRTLAQSLLRRLEEALEVDRANLYLVDSGSEALHLLEQDPDVPVKVDLSTLPKDLWQEDVASLDGILLPSESLSPLQHLHLAGYRYAFPLRVRNHRVGLLVASYKNEGVPLNSEDEDLVLQLLQSAALAIENAQLVDELEDRLDEVSRLRDYNEGIIQSSPAGIAVLDAADRVVSANDALAGWLGADAASLAGRALSELLPTQPSPKADGTPLEVSYCDLSGEEHHLRMTTSAYRDSREGRAGRGGRSEESEKGADSEQATRRILVVHNISDRVAMEKAMLEQERLAALGLLAAGVAHEVNTPITGISSYAQMLLEDTPESDPRHSLLRKVERQTFRASRIVNNLLDFARNRDGERQALDLRPLVEETLDLLGDRRQQRGARVDVDLGTEPLEVMGSEGELQQVFTNLLVNALDAVDRGEGRLVLTSGQTNDEVWVRVEDNGPGIPAERLEQIFKPFFSSKGSGGTGLGLSISHEIIERHGGHLDVASDASFGTRFTVTLPALSSIKNALVEPEAPSAPA